MTKIIKNTYKTTSTALQKHAQMSTNDNNMLAYLCSWTAAFSECFHLEFNL